MEITNKVQNIVIESINIVHKLIFRAPITPGIRGFVKNYYWSFLGMSAATFIMFFLHVLGGRFIGPTEYGKYSLIMSLANFFLLPIALGFGGAIQKYLPQAKTESKKIISTAYFILFFLAIAWLLIYFILQKVIIRLIKIDATIFWLSILFALALTAYQLTDATMQGFLKIKKASLIRIISFVVLIILFIYLLFFENKLNFISLFIPCMAAYLLFSLLVLININKYFFEFSWKWAKILIHFSIYAIFARLSFIIFTNVDKLFINYFLSLKEIGIYQAYISSSQSINLFLGAFIAVYFPTVSQVKDKFSIFKRINRISIPLFVSVFLFLSGTMFVLLKIYGKEYPISFGLIMLFAAGGGLYTLHGLYGFLLSSKNIRSIKMVSIYVFLAMIFNVISNLIFIPFLGLYGAALSTVLTYGALVVLYLNTKGKILKE